METALEELPQIYKIMVNLIGREGAFEIGKEFGGENIYLPSLSKTVVPRRNAKIAEEFNGFNFKELAKKYGLVERHIRDIIEKGKNKRGEHN